MAERHGQAGKYLWEIKRLLEASPAGEVSVVNSSTATLGGGATFTGEGESNLSPDALVSCHTDVDGTLFFDFSNDGVNYTTFPVNGFAVTANIHEFHTAVKGPRYFRVRLVNGAGTQSFLRLYVYYGAFRQPNAPLSQDIAADADAIIVRSVNSVLDLQRGAFAGQSIGDKFGYISGLGTSVQEGTPASWVDLWAYGGQRTSPSGTFTPFMASSSSADTDIDIQWVYQDAAGIEQAVTVATDASDGQTPVSLGVTATESYRGFNDDATELVGNVALASANNFTAGVPDNQNEVLADIPAGNGKTQVLAQRVPSDKRFLFQYLKGTMTRLSGAAGSALADLQVRRAGKTFVTERPLSCSDSLPIDEDLTAIVLEPGDDYRVRIKDVSDNSTTLRANLYFYAVDV